jgi:hypothetical protein
MPISLSKLLSVPRPRSTCAYCAFLLRAVYKEVVGPTTGTWKVKANHMCAMGKMFEATPGLQRKVASCLWPESVWRAGVFVLARPDGPWITVFLSPTALTASHVEAICDFWGSNPPVDSYCVECRHVSHWVTALVNNQELVHEGTP